MKKKNPNASKQNTLTLSKYTKNPNHGAIVPEYPGILRRSAFTLAEVLITLAIIGVVAALTIPTVLKDYNDKKYNTARLKALKTFGEAGKMASINGEINGQENARAFVENVLSKYLKILKVCDTAEECGFPSQIQPSNQASAKISVASLSSWNKIGVNWTANDWTATSDTNLSTYLTTNDGFSAKLFYNPKCLRNTFENPFSLPCTGKECVVYAVDIACINVIYDMNGAKAPNHVGEDIGFVTTIWSGLKAASVAPGILPYPMNSESPYKSSPEAIEYCNSLGTEKLISYLPNVDELVSVMLNEKLLSKQNVSAWSSTPVPWSPSEYWFIANTGYRAPLLRYRGYMAWCIRR